MYSVGQWSECLKTVLQAIYDKFGSDPVSVANTNLAHEEDSGKSDDSDEEDISQIINSVVPRRDRTISPIPNYEDKNTEQQLDMPVLIEPPSKLIKESTPLAIRKPSRKKKPRRHIMDTPN